MAKAYMHLFARFGNPAAGRNILWYAVYMALIIAAQLSYGVWATIVAALTWNAFFEITAEWEVANAQEQGLS